MPKRGKRDTGNSDTDIKMFISHLWSKNSFVKWDRCNFICIFLHLHSIWIVSPFPPPNNRSSLSIAKDREARSFLWLPHFQFPPLWRKICCIFCFITLDLTEQRMIKYENRHSLWQKSQISPKSPHFNFLQTTKKDLQYLSHYPTRFYTNIWHVYIL